MPALGQHEPPMFHLIRLLTYLGLAGHDMYENFDQEVVYERNYVIIWERWV